MVTWPQALWQIMVAVSGREELFSTSWWAEEKETEMREAQ
jgi:hypothetical protein